MRAAALLFLLVVIATVSESDGVLRRVKDIWRVVKVVKNWPKVKETARKVKEGAKQIKDWWNRLKRADVNALDDIDDTEILNAVATRGLDDLMDARDLDENSMAELSTFQQEAQAVMQELSEYE